MWKLVPCSYFLQRHLPQVSWPFADFKWQVVTPLGAARSGLIFVGSRMRMRPQDATRQTIQNAGTRGLGFGVDVGHGTKNDTGKFESV